MDVSKLKKRITEHSKWVLMQYLSGLVLIAILEVLSRHSLTAGIGFVWGHPFLVLYSALLLLCLFSFSNVLIKNQFWFVLIYGAVLILGIANCILLFFRITPLSASDFSLLSSVFVIMDRYLEVWQIIAVVGILLVMLAVIIRFFRKKKTKNQFRLLGMIDLVGVLVLTFCVTIVSEQKSLLPDKFDNLPDAYREYGFVYCFSQSLLDKGIDKPEDYSEEMIDVAFADLERVKTKTPDFSPNIIFLQIESFFDVSRLRGVSYSENPIPVFSTLLDSCPYGYLRVPSVGAGTANTEFEILSGMSLDYFGTGEYPYQTILRDSTCESLAYNLRENDYYSTAIHNNTGFFYNRDEVFANLGFDCFICEEYLRNMSYNEIGWAKDSVLTQPILASMKESEQRDLIYAITVQDHGKYPTDPIENPHISAQGFAAGDEERQNSFTYYLNQVHETDQFLGYLISVLNDFDEPVMLVMYGDHLPNLEIEPQELERGDEFETEYIIWTNREMKKYRQFEHERKDLCAYQLSAYLLDMIGMNNGILTKYHQKYHTMPYYETRLETLQYDMLYGEKEIFGGKEKYRRTKLKMGLFPISMHDVMIVGDIAYITGDNFTPSSRIVVDDEILDTTYVTESILTADGDQLKDGDLIYVAQCTELGEIFSKVGPIQFKDYMKK